MNHRLALRGISVPHAALLPAGCLDDEPEMGAANHLSSASNAPRHEIVDYLPQHDKRPG